jgi:hypothetical protein
MPTHVTRRIHPSSGLAALAMTLVVSWPLPALAQAPAPATPKKWTFELYGGGVQETQSSAGSPIAQFPIGATFLAESGFDSRLHQSWRFGDGAALFNQVATQFTQIAGRPFTMITPMDDVLRAGGSRQGARAAFGLRLGRAISPTLSLELLVERGNGGLTAGDAALATLAAANASFDAAFRELLATAPVTSVQVDSAVTTGSSSQSQTRIIGAVSRILVQRPRWSLAGTAGAGIQMRGGDPADVRLNGRYAFSLFGSSGFSERDDVTVRFHESDGAALGLLGIMLTYDAAPTTAFRLGLRAHLTANNTTTSIMTAPQVATASATSAFLPTNTSPSLQFSNQTIPLSSLNPALATTLTTFTGSGVNRQFLFTVGIVQRF